MTSSIPNRPDEPVSPSRLRDVGLFGALSDEVLEHLGRHLQPQRVQPGTFVFREGDPAREFYVVLDGEMESVERKESKAASREQHPRAT
jgi:CRP-like cAMP-binding protein